MRLATKVIASLLFAAIASKVTLRLVHSDISTTAAASTPASTLPPAPPNEMPNIAPSSLPPESYPDSVKVAYLHMRDDVMARVYFFNYADSCHIFDQSDDAQKAGELAVSLLQQEAAKMSVKDDAITQLYNQAIKSGHDSATSEGCDYWKSNPDQVTQMRGIARLSNPR